MKTTSQAEEGTTDWLNKRSLAFRELSDSFSALSTEDMRFVARELALRCELLTDKDRWIDSPDKLSKVGEWTLLDILRWFDALPQTEQWIVARWFGLRSGARLRVDEEFRDWIPFPKKVIHHPNRYAMLLWVRPKDYAELLRLQLIATMVREAGTDGVNIPVLDHALRYLDRPWLPQNEMCSVDFAEYRLCISEIPEIEHGESDRYELVEKLSPLFVRFEPSTGYRRVFWGSKDFEELAPTHDMTRLARLLLRCLAPNASGRAPG